MKAKYRKILNLSLIIFCSVIADVTCAGAKNITILPSDACNYLSDLPFINKPSIYKPNYQGSPDYMCGTRYYVIHSLNNSTMENNIAYYVDGLKDNVTKMMIMLNVNDTDTNSLNVSNGFYVNAVFELLNKTFTDGSNAKVIADTIDDITNGKDVSVVVDGWDVSSVKNVWSTGAGYDLTFTISTH